jgi:hypothetical protein
VSVNSGLQYRPTLIILSNLQVLIKELDQPGEDDAGTGIEVGPLIMLYSLIYTVQQRHHDIYTDHVPFSNNSPVHNLPLNFILLCFCPLMDPALGKKAKRWIWWGMRERMTDSGQFIAAVGHPSRQSFPDVRTRGPREHA